MQKHLFFFFLMTISVWDIINNEQKQFISVTYQKCTITFYLSTTIYNYLSSILSDQEVSKRTQQVTRAHPLCSACKKPTRGHRSLIDCPKNRKKSWDAPSTAVPTSRFVLLCKWRKKKRENSLNMPWTEEICNFSTDR